MGFPGRRDQESPAVSQMQAPSAGGSQPCLFFPALGGVVEAPPTDGEQLWVPLLPSVFAGSLLVAGS